MAKLANKHKTSLSYTPAPLCHVSPKKVFEVGNTAVFGGKWSAMRAQHSATALFHLDDLLTQRGAEELDGAVMASEDHPLFDGLETAPPPVLNIDWPDFAAPRLDRDWWNTLVDNLRSYPAAAAVGFSCEGGHGRTGTALTIVGCLAGAIPEAVDPVLWLRKHYCTRAVESKEQLAYITRITGRDVHAVAAETLRVWDQLPSSLAGYDPDEDPETQDWNGPHSH